MTKDTSKQVITLQQDVKELRECIEQLNKEFKSINKNLDTNTSTLKLISLGTFSATAYDLWEIPKQVYEEERFTADGTDLVGKDILDGIIAVDPNVIPLGTVVYIEFPHNPKFNGRYTARDTGRLIKGNRLDVFTGADTYDEHIKLTNSFGYKEVKVYLIEELSDSEP